MSETIQARFPAAFPAGRPSAADAVRAIEPSAPGAAGVVIAVAEDMAAIEQDWRGFETTAACTVFQSFDWLATWQRCIGAPSGAAPAIVTGRDAGGAILFILPLAVRRAGLARELSWLGSDLCDYNGPLLAADFGARFDRARFLELWDAIAQEIQTHPRLRFDYVNFVKMPQMVGAQPNPMLALGVTANPSGAYLTHLSDNWETFYAQRRSSETRRRDRTKRKRLADLGAVHLVNAERNDDILATLDTLMTQKARSFARMGVANLFAKPGYAAFYRALATGPSSRRLVHVSRLDVGAIPAAVNIGLTFGDCYYHLQASYDDGEVSRFGPGVAHLHELMRQAIERGFRKYDFTIGDERYKRDWCDTEISLHDHIAPVTWRGALVAVPMMNLNRLKRWIKQTPAAWNAFSKARAAIGGLARALAAKFSR